MDVQTDHRCCVLTVSLTLNNIQKDLLKLNSIVKMKIINESNYNK